MLYKTLYISFEEKCTLKDLVMQNDPRVYATLELFESHHTLYAFQEDIRLLLDSLASSTVQEAEDCITSSPFSVDSTAVHIQRTEWVHSKWKVNVNSLCRQGHLELKRVAALSLENCVVVVKSGWPSPTNDRDWEWSSSSVPQRLLELHNNGFDILLLSSLEIPLSSER